MLIKNNYNYTHLNLIFFTYRYIKLTFFLENFNNLEFKLNILIFFKKINCFLTNKNYKSVIFNKLMFTLKKKNLNFKPINKKFFRENQYTINNKIIKTINFNRKVFKLFFLKKYSKQKKITKHISSIIKKKYRHAHLFNSNLCFVLLRSHFFFFLNDAYFFLKKSFIFVNGLVVKNNFFDLKVGDCIQIIKSDFYYDYMFNINKFFKQKIKKLKYRRWVCAQRKKATGLFFKN